MEKISREVFEQSRTRKQPLIQLLDEITIDEGVLLKRDEWTPKTSPNSYVGQMFRQPRSNKRFKVRTLKDGAGWVFLRIK